MNLDLNISWKIETVQLAISVMAVSVRLKLDGRVLDMQKIESSDAELYSPTLLGERGLASSTEDRLQSLSKSTVTLELTMTNL